MFSNIIEIIILSIVQGISEFLPISSSAHLNIVEIIFEFNSNSLMIDVSLHLGSLLAIIFSLEGVFATIAAWILLDQILDINNLFGCLFILFGVLFSQLVPIFKKN